MCIRDRANARQRFKLLRRRGVDVHERHNARGRGDLVGLVLRRHSIIPVRGALVGRFVQKNERNGEQHRCV